MNKCLFKGALVAGALFAAALGSDAMAQGQQSKSKANNAPAAKQAKVTAANQPNSAGADVMATGLLPAAPGTYQIQAKDAVSHEVFPIDILIEIEKNRHRDEVVFLKAGKSSLIKILPYSQITAENFVPLPEYGVQE